MMPSNRQRGQGMGLAVCPGSKGEKECWWTLAGSVAENPWGRAPWPLLSSERGGDEEAGRNKNVRSMLDEKQKGICVCSCTFFITNYFLWICDFLIQYARWAYFGKLAKNVFSLVLQKTLLFSAGKITCELRLSYIWLWLVCCTNGIRRLYLEDSLVLPPPLLIFSKFNSGVV